ncbi:MAG: polymer-forming cytoskeletal protein [Spirochaetaceae bacterium]|nr:polymer-forming cytoskeletal protein [Spirochaetaceae bacterium]
MQNFKDNDFFDLEEEDFDTILYEDIDFTGSITFTQPLMIKGKVTGTIDTNSDLVIDTEATVQANIIAKRVLVKGLLTGDITAEQLVFVASSGKVTGNITAAQVVLEPGSRFSGQCSMISSSETESDEL